MNIRIERAKNKDAKALLGIQKRAFKPLYEYYGDSQSPYLQNKADIVARMETKGNDYYKVFADNMLVGLVRIVKHGEARYKLTGVSIKPEYQNKGVARKAIALAESYYPDAKKWFLDFPIDRPMNQKCYEYLGYKDTGKRKKINERLTLAVYEKEI